MAEDTAVAFTQPEHIKYLIEQLNKYTKAYDEGHPLISDAQWDEMYYELVKLEKEAGIYYPNSPTQSISYEVINSLEKIEHNHKMLSLGKTKQLEDIVSFIGNTPTITMSKMDGLTISLLYRNGKLVTAETRGNGAVGELVTSNAKVIKNIPQTIPYEKELIVDGEVICTYSDFDAMTSDYKHPRNFAAGSIRLLDAAESAKRNLTFVAWEVITDIAETLAAKLDLIKQWGFTIVPYHIINENISTQTLQTSIVDSLTYEARDKSYPIDGLVFKYNNCAYGRSLGETSHHPKNAIALKFYDETYETTLLDIEWQLSRTGQINPVAVFEEVEIDGTSVSKASLSNLTILHNTLNMPWRGQIINVSKRNQIIPKIETADIDTIPDDDTLYISMPAQCPVCGGRVIVRKDNDSEVLYCDNSHCEGKFLTALDHFCSKNGLDIKGLSAATLEKLVNWGWVERFGDIFTLAGHRDEWVKKPGFGVASVNKILTAIDTGSHCELDAFISAIGIPLIGRNTAKELVKHFPTWQSFIDAVESNYPFYQLSGFGRELNQSLINYDYTEARYIAHNFISFTEPVTQETKTDLNGKIIAITGKISHWKNRDELKTYIESLGGKVSSSVSGKTTYLINNDSASNSAKNNQAKKLNIPILTEEDFLKLLKNNS